MTRAIACADCPRVSVPLNCRNTEEHEAALRERGWGNRPIEGSPREFYLVCPDCLRKWERKQTAP